MTQYLLSTTGRYVSMYTAAVVTSVAATAYISIHGMFHKKYMNFLQLYHNGFPVPVPEELKEMTEKIVEDCQVDKYVAKNQELFSVYGFDTVTIGSFHLRWGTHIGIPKHFYYKTVDNIDKSKLKLGEKNIDWSSEAGRQLSESLILSESAKMFAIAREICFSQTYKCHFQTGLIALFGGLSYYVGLAINTFGKLLERPAKFRYLMYTMNISFHLLSYIFSRDLLNTHYEAFTDRKTAELEGKYLPGGLEYYQKMIQRNIALYTLMGKLGAKKYTVYGNEIELFRTQHIPLTARKDFFANKIKLLNTNF